MAKKQIDEEGKIKKSITLNKETLEILERLSKKFGATENVIISLAIQKYGVDWDIK